LEAGAPVLVAELGWQQPEKAKRTSTPYRLAKTDFALAGNTIMRKSPRGDSGGRRGGGGELGTGDGAQVLRGLLTTSAMLSDTMSNAVAA